MTRTDDIAKARRRRDYRAVGPPPDQLPLMHPWMLHTLVVSALHVVNELAEALDEGNAAETVARWAEVAESRAAMGEIVEYMRGVMVEIDRQDAEDTDAAT